MACKPPRDYGKRNLKALRNGLKPPRVICWPNQVVSDHLCQRAADVPLSDFAAQILADHPGLTVEEARIVAETMLRCADHAALRRQIP